MIRKAEASNIVVRMPRKVKAWIEEQAAKNCSSQNSEIVRALIARMECTPVAEDR